MTIDVAIAAPDFQARWAVWQARGVQQDLATRRQLMWVASAVVLGLAIWSLNIVISS